MFYGSHFSATELDELITVQKDVLNQKTPTLSEALKAKYLEQMTTIQSEIYAGTTKLGAKLGGDIGMELAKEHLEWEKQIEDATASQSKPQ